MDLLDAFHYLQISQNWIPLQDYIQNEVYKNDMMRQQNYEKNFIEPPKSAVKTSNFLEFHLKNYRVCDNFVLRKMLVISNITFKNWIVLLTDNVIFCMPYIVTL